MARLKNGPKVTEYYHVQCLCSPAILTLEEGRGDGNLLQFYVTLPEADKYLLIYVFLKLGGWVGMR